MKMRKLLMVKNGASAALIILLISMLIGCWDRREIEERTSVFAIGIDRMSEQSELLEVSVQIPIPIRISGSSGSGGSEDGQHTVKVEKASGRTVLEAMQSLQKKVNQQLFYGHTRVIAISEEAARMGVSTFFDSFRRDPQIRRLLWPIVIKGRAVDVLRINPNLEQIPTVYVMTMLENGAKTGTTTSMNLGLFFIKLTSKSRQPYLNYFQVSNGKLNWSGLALFHGDRMVGTLNDKETWALLRMAEKKNGGNISIPYQGDPSKLVTLNTVFASRKEKISYQNGIVEARIHMEIESNVLEKTFSSNLFNAEEIAQIEHDSEAYLNDTTNAVIQKLQQVYKTDVIGIGSRIRAYHPTTWRQLSWESDFPRAAIKTSFKVKIRNTGIETN